MERAVLEADNLARGNHLIYMYLARDLIRAYGIDGEAAVRKGLVAYATVRGSYLRRTHMALGMKTNLKNHYYYNANPYQGSSIQENIGHVTEEEDVRTVDKCMFPEDLAARGERKLAIMYCEEVHPPLWQSYAPTAIVNLGKHLSQEGSKACLFDVFLRPGRMTPEQRKECFEAYDPDFKGDRREEYPFLSDKEGGMFKVVIMFTELYRVAVGTFGPAAREVIRSAANAFLDDYLACIRQTAETLDLPLDDDFFDRNCCLERDPEREKFWEVFSTPEITAFARESIYEPLEKKWRALRS